MTESLPSPELEQVRETIEKPTKILKSVESYKGKIGSRDLKLCDDYAVDVFGPINLQSRAFDVIGYTAEYRETKTHPTSHVAFAGNVIPVYGACVRTVTELHRKAPYTRCIGWDVTVDREEHVRLME